MRVHLERGEEGTTEPCHSLPHEAELGSVFERISKYIELRRAQETALTHNTSTAEMGGRMRYITNVSGSYRGRYIGLSPRLETTANVQERKEDWRWG